MTALSRTAEDAVMRAAAGYLIHAALVQELTAAMHASNPRSARVHLREAEYDLEQMLRRVREGITELDRDLKSDDDAAEERAAKALDFPPKLRLVL